MKSMAKSVARKARYSAVGDTAARVGKAARVVGRELITGPMGPTLVLQAGLTGYAVGEYLNDKYNVSGRISDYLMQQKDQKSGYARKPDSAFPQNAGYDKRKKGK
jgi:hypothetical protein